MSQTEIEEALTNIGKESWKSPVQPRIEKMSNFVMGRLFELQAVESSELDDFDQDDFRLAA